MTPQVEILDAIGTVVGAVLTIMIFSYLLGDNPLYRLALHLFVGALVGYTFGVIVREVGAKLILPQLVVNPLAVVVPVVLGLLLLFKGFPRQAYIGNFSVAYLTGVGAAVALGGALVGTIVPQIGATGRALSLTSLEAFVNGGVIIVGTICTLMAFNFAVGKQQGVASVWTRVVTVLGGVGRVFLIVALGVAFAGALTASLSIFVGRFQYIIQDAADAVGMIYSYLMGSG